MAMVLLPRAQNTGRARRLNNCTCVRPRRLLVAQIFFGLAQKMFYVSSQDS